MQFLAVVFGVVLIGSVLADLVNTLVATQTAQGRFWLTRILYTRTWVVVRWVGRRISDDDRRHRFYSLYAPLSVLTTALVIGYLPALYSAYNEREAMAARGFDLVEREEARAHTRELRSLYGAELELLIDLLEAPRGFWGHSIGLPIRTRSADTVLPAVLSSTDNEETRP